MYAARFFVVSLRTNEQVLQPAQRYMTAKLYTFTLSFWISQKLSMVGKPWDA